MRRLFGTSPVAEATPEIRLRPAGVSKPRSVGSFGAAAYSGVEEVD
ncbi:hypothetical protein [Erythrobacter aureus]|nr:hypothetical protein [Erythrobacter aureus]